MRTPSRSIPGLHLLLLALGIVACDQRALPTRASIRVPPITAPTGDYLLRSVDSKPLPHVTSAGGTVYRLMAGSLEIHSDSTWLFHTNTHVTASDGTFLQTSPANYTGRWTANDTVIVLTNPESGTIRVKGDTLFWTGGPRHSWESPLVFALTK
jgi:hypothetical protein